jgi:uncharacterized MAPEG superfamily protein
MKRTIILVAIFILILSPLLVAQEAKSGIDVILNHSGIDAVSAAS